MNYWEKPTHSWLHPQESFTFFRCFEFFFGRRAKGTRSINKSDPFLLAETGALESINLIYIYIHIHIAMVWGLIWSLAPFFYRTGQRTWIRFFFIFFPASRRATYYSTSQFFTWSSTWTTMNSCKFCWKKMLSTRKPRKSKTINIIVYPGIVDEINPHFKIMGSFRFKLPLNGQQMDSQGKQTSLNRPPLQLEFVFELIPGGRICWCAPKKTSPPGSLWCEHSTKRRDNIPWKIE